MIETERNITNEELFLVLKEQYRMLCLLDCEVDKKFDFVETSTIQEWAHAMELNSNELPVYINDLFDISISKNDWLEILKSAEVITLKSICEFLSKHIKIEIVKPIKVFGKECLSASIFHIIKMDLKRKGIYTDPITPSTKISPYLENTDGKFIMEISKKFPGVITKFDKVRTKYDKIHRIIWLSFSLGVILSFVWLPVLIIAMWLFTIGVKTQRIRKSEKEKVGGTMYIPDILTFRDLVCKIIDNDTLYNSR